MAESIPASSLRFPDFIIAGAQKCGTTSLHRYLSAHPGLFLPHRPQELHYFDFDQNFAKGTRWFASHFKSARPLQKIGQTSPLYMYDERVPLRLAETLPEVRLIFLLRDPVERAYSHYWHQVKKGTEDLSFIHALHQEQERITRDYDSRRQYSYVDRGKYAQQLERFSALFPMAHILLLATEVLGKRPLETLDRCFDFLGVDHLPSDVVAELVVHRFNQARLPRWPGLQRLVGRHRSQLPLLAGVVDKLNLRPATNPPMTAEARRFLDLQFMDDNARLAEKFGFDTSAWGKHARKDVDASRSQISEFDADLSLPLRGP